MIYRWYIRDNTDLILGNVGIKLHTERTIRFVIFQRICNIIWNIFVKGFQPEVDIIECQRYLSRLTFFVLENIKKVLQIESALFDFVSYF